MQHTAGERPVRRQPGDLSTVDALAVEEPLEIRVDGERLVVTMRTPGHDEQLAAGFCWTEGVVDHPDQIESVRTCGTARFGNVVDVTLSEDARDSRAARVREARRDWVISSSCGLCGTTSIERLKKQSQMFDSNWQLPAEFPGRLPEQMRREQEAFARTGGLHAAAWFDSKGELKLLYEDVGRHNALDKLAGSRLLSGQIEEQCGVLLVSGRVSFELVQKAARARLPFLAALGAPTSIAVDAAQELGMTLVGFLKSDGRYNIYADPGRIGIDAAGRPGLGRSPPVDAR